jgi:propanol-preferring alcohol dehydrogenase
MVLKAVGQHLVEVMRDVPQPDTGQALIEITACAVCRTDLHVVDGDLSNPKLPLVPGHEIVGRVLAIAQDVKNLRCGDRIGVPWLGHTCGACPYCQSGRENLCDFAEFTGYQIDGGYATHAVADARYCFRLPNGYDDVHAAPLLCAGLIGYRALKAAGPSRRLGIYGFGAAAHIVAQIARHNHQEVFAFTRPGDAAAQQLALSLGCVWAGGTEAKLEELLDAAIIFAPAGELVPLALRQLKKGATLMLGGIHMSPLPQMPYEILWGERSIKSIANHTRQDGVEFMELAARLPLDINVETFPLTAANEALARLRSGQLTGAAVLVPGSRR